MNATETKTFVASFLGWTLDAFDFFLVIVVVPHIAADFKMGVAAFATAITLTLAMRPVGALIFGWFADRYGRRVPLMVDIGLYSAIELATAFAPNFTVFLILRAIFGIAMGGEWGLGSALAMEALPANRRGLFSGMLQQDKRSSFSSPSSVGAACSSSARSPRCSSSSSAPTSPNPKSGKPATPNA